MNSLVRTFATRWWVAAISIAVLVTPFWRGGRDGSGYLAAAVLLFLAWLLWSHRTRLQREIPTYVLLPLVLFSGWNLLSLLWAQAPYYAILRFFVVVLAGILFVLVRQVGYSRDDRERLVHAFMALSIPVMGFGAYLYFDRVYDRAASFFYAPNEYALYLLLVWLIGLYWWTYKPNRLRVVFLVLVASQFLLIQSLATTVLALVATLALVWLRQVPRRQLLVLITAITVGLLLSVGMVNIKDRVGSTNVGTPDLDTELVETKVSGVSSRFAYWGDSLDIYEDNVVFGVGADNFQVVYPEYQNDPSLFTQNPHNFFLQTHAELGILGGLFLLLIIVMTSVFYYRNRHSSEAQVYAIMLSSVLLHSSFYQTSRYPVFWFIAAMLLALLFTSSSHTKAMEVAPRSSSGYVAVAAAIAIFAGLHYRTATFAATGFDFSRERNVVDSNYYLEIAADGVLVEPRVYQLLSTQLTFAGEFERAEDFADRAIASDKSGASYAAKAFALRRSSAADEDINLYYQVAIERDPFNSIDAYVTYTRYLLDQGQTDLAGNIFAFIMPYYEDEDLPNIIQFGELPRKVSLLLFQQARWASVTGDTQLERAALERSLELNPSFPIAEALLEQLNQRER